MMRNHRSILLAAAVIAGGVAGRVAGRVAGAQPSLPPGCDAKLARGAGRGGPDAYTKRGTPAKWCEGVSKQEVGNVELRLQAFTEVTAAVDAGALRRLDTLVVQWNAPAGMTVHIVARQSTDPLADYYQLDVEAPTAQDGVGTWSWPTEILYRAGMWPVSVTDARAGDRAPALSVQATGRFASDPSGDSVYIPVRITPKSAARAATPTETRPATAQRLQISMTAKERVSVRRPNLFRTADDGSTKPVTMARGCPAITGGAVGGDPVTITVCMPADATSGVYLLTIGATSDAAMIRATGIRFYYGALARR